MLQRLFLISGRQSKKALCGQMRNSTVTSCFLKRVCYVVLILSLCAPRRTSVTRA